MASPATFARPVLASGGAWKVNVTVALHFLPLLQIDFVQAVHLGIDCLADFIRQGRHDIQVELQPHTRKSDVQERLGADLLAVAPRSQSHLRGEPAHLAVLGAGVHQRADNARAVLP